LELLEAAASARAFLKSTNEGQSGWWISIKDTPGMSMIGKTMLAK